MALDRFVRTELRYADLDSTSNEARRRLSTEQADEALPLLIVADRQNQGRGRGSNAWYSDAGSLTFTLVLDPAQHALRSDQEACLALVAAAAICDALEPRWLDPGSTQIRWPNDVEVDGRKIAGILLERVLTPRGTRLLLGIGLNVSTNLANAPLDVQRMATSLAACRGAALPESHKALLERVVDAIGALVRRMAGGEEHLAQLWETRDALAGRLVRVRLGDRVLEGTGAGIDEGGRLRLATESGVETVVGGIVLR